MQSKATGPSCSTQKKTLSYSRSLVTGILLLALLTGTMLFSGCTNQTQGKDPVTGTWEWSDGKGYTERYTFNPDHSFHAQALGSEFNGTWAISSPDHYEVIYTNRNDTSHSETLTELVHYDSKTDEIYFPGHRRVV
jgi:hypothetical protein